MPTTIRDRERHFWSRVDRDGPVPAHRPELGPCWVWTRNHLPKGYGLFWNGKKHELAHRASWRFTNGDAGSLLVLHACDRPSCVRPDHLFVGTNADNARDMCAKGRGRNGDPRGEQNGRAKHSNADVAEIRRLRASGASLREIAAQYGMSVRAVSKIATGVSWKHLPGIVTGVRANKIMLAFAGERLSLREWAERIGIQADTISHRLRRGWPVERALSGSSNVR